MPRAQTNRTERLNLFLTKAEREAIAEIAKREDRDAGYIAAWFVRWGLRQYLKLNTSLLTMNTIQLHSQAGIEEQAKIRLELREEAQHIHEIGEVRERKRA